MLKNRKCLSNFFKEFLFDFKSPIVLIIIKEELFWKLLETYLLCIHLNWLSSSKVFLSQTKNFEKIALNAVNVYAGRIEELDISVMYTTVLLMLVTNVFSEVFFIAVVDT